MEFGGENMSSALEPLLCSKPWLGCWWWASQGACERAQGRSRELSDPKQFGHVLFLREWCFCCSIGAKKTPSVPAVWSPASSWGW